MKDMLRVDISADERQFREATGLVRFDDDPDGTFFATIDSNTGALSDQINQAVLGVLRRANANVEWTVSTQPWSTPMTDRGRYERALSGAPVPGKKRGPKPRDPRVAR
jgi:hypothetical protein